MGRMTRAKAAAVANTMHIEEDDVLELPSEVLPASDAKPTTPERAVLGEIAPNSSESKTPAEIVPRKTRGRKKAEEKAARSDEQAEVVGQDSEEAVVKELNGEPDGEGQAEEDVQANVDQTEDAQVEDDSLDITTNETMERLAKLRITSIGNQSVAQTNSPVQLEQSEIPANAPEVEESASPALDEPVITNDEESLAPVATPAEEQSSSELPSISIDTKPQQEGNEAEQPEENVMLEAPGSPVATAVPKVIKDLRMETPGKRSTSNKENVEPIEPVGAVESVESAQIASSPSVPTNAQPASPSQNASVDAVATESTASPSVRRPSSSKSEDPIEALDELEDAVEKINSEIPDLTSSPKRSEKATDDKAKPADEKEKPKKVKPAPVVRLTKATQARLSLAQGGNKDQGKASATARPRPSTTLGRASSVRQSVVPSAARRDPKSTSTTNKPDSRPKKETVIPHSKPRPVSLSFPTPPPAARSSKAPTKSTFQLPGEAVAAKLKAAREERLKREASLAASKSNDKASAAATEKKPAFRARPVPSTLKATPSVRQTAASRARESTINGGASTTATKRPTSTSNATKPRPSTTAPAPKSSQPSLTISKRPRPSSVQAPTSTTTATTTTRNPSSSSAPRSTSTTSKGKEVYARAAAAKEAAESSKREKEDAARKARAAAAERGRAASREWAEKQKATKAAAAVPGGAPAAAAGAVGGESEVVAA